MSTIDPAALAVANAHNHFEATKAFSTVREKVQAGDCSVTLSGTPFALFNGIFLANFSAPTLKQQVAQALAAFRAKGVPGYFWVDATCRTPELKRELLEQGCTHAGVIEDGALDIQEFFGVAIGTPRSALPRLPTGIELVKVATASEIETWSNLLADSFSLPDFARRHLIEVQADPHRCESLVNYLAFRAGEVVATISGFFSNSVCGVYSLAVRQDVRRQDIAKGVLLELLLDSHGRGTRYAVGSAFSQLMGFYRKAPVVELGATEFFQI
jgi:hypothetical protein